MGKLTDRAVLSAKATENELLLNDGDGLYLRVYPSGKKIFIYRYKNRLGSTKKLVIGLYPQKSLKQARLEVAEYNAQRKEGNDPAALLAIEKAKKIALSDAVHARDNRITISALFDRWEKLALCNHKDGGKAIRRMFEKDVLPTLGKMAVEDVTKAHVIAVVDALLSRGVNRMAKMILALMRQMFRFAQDRDIIENDPTATIRKSKIGKPDTERDRWLSEGEIKELVKALPNAGLSKTTEAAIWIALATGCRIGELLKARWQEVNLEKGIWTITAENSKNGEPLTIYLSEFAIKQFKLVQSVNHETEWCYPNRDGKTHVCDKTVTKQIGDRQLYGERKPMSKRSKHAEALKLSGGKWTPHDLRRTAATLMTALGVLPDIADRCLNHKEQNRIRRTYLRHSYEREMRDAWKLLGDRLDVLTSNTDNVHIDRFGGAHDK